MKLRAAARLLVAAAIALTSTGVASGTANAILPPEPDPLSVLFFGPTSGGLAATTPGITATVWDAATWSSKTTADFQRFDAIVFGDQPQCGVEQSTWAAAVANRAVWSAAVTGNVILNGTDPDWHGKTQLVHQSVQFATDGVGTGLYVSLSCAYYNWDPMQVDLLGGLGTFEVRGVANCPSLAHKVANHPTLDGIDDTYLSGWDCSAHEGFVTYPGDYTPLAIIMDAENEPIPAPTFSDGTTGMAYILAKGATSFPLSISPVNGRAPKGDVHTVTATFTDDVGTFLHHQVQMHVTAGPNAGTALQCPFGSCLTNDQGQVTGTYRGTAYFGVDTIEAYVDLDQDLVADSGEPRATASMTWLRPVRYTSLGDSFSAGEGLRPYLSPTRCHRSYDAYSRKTQGPGYSGTYQSYADNIQFSGEVTHDFIACSGAEVPNVQEFGVRKHGEPAQLDQDKVTPYTNLVTITIGGNDVGFAPILGECALSDCLDPYNVTFGDLGEDLATWLPKKVDSMYEPLLNLYREIKDSASSSAAIVTMSYPHLFPDSQAEQTCPKLSYFFTVAEQTLVNQMTDRFADVIADAAADAGIHYVDVRSAFSGHAVCGSAGEWINGMTKYHEGKGLGVGDATFHPKVEGQTAYASQLSGYLQSLVDNGWATEDTGLPRNPEPRLPMSSGPMAMSAMAATTSTALGGYGRAVVDPVSTTATCHETDSYGTGQQIRVTADGFVPGTSVQLKLVNEAKVATTVGTYTANADGVVTTTLAIPASYAPDSIGTFRATGTALDNGPRTDLGQFYVDTLPAACATTPTVTSLSPQGGVTAGGTAVTITGTGFTAPATVKFGTKAATSVVVNSTTSITATSPAGTAGTVQVTVTTAAGTSATGTASEFLYGSVPTIKSISPKTIQAGTTATVTVSGTGFVPGKTQVVFATGTVTYPATTYYTATVASSTQLTFVVSHGACPLRESIVDVRALTPVGISATSNATKLTFSGTPSRDCTQPR